MSLSSRRVSGTMEVMPTPPVFLRVKDMAGGARLRRMPTLSSSLRGAGQAMMGAARSRQQALLPAACSTASARVVGHQGSCGEGAGASHLVRMSLWNQGLVASSTMSSRSALLHTAITCHAHCAEGHRVRQHRQRAAVGPAEGAQESSE